MNGDTVAKSGEAKGDAVAKDAVVTEAVATYAASTPPVATAASYAAASAAESSCPPPCPNPDAIRTPESAWASLIRQVRSGAEVSAAEREALKSTEFSNWELTDLQLFLYLRQMFVDLGFLEAFNIEARTLENFLLEVYKRYNRVAFHNFSHCFMVAQMAYALVWTNQLWTKYSKLELMCLLLAAVCHDLDHPGLSNHYQRKVGTVLAVRYKGCAPLENHHLAVTFRILSSESCDLLSGLSPSDCLRAREWIVRLILATDMSRHRDTMAEFAEIAEKVDFGDERHRELVLRMLIKTADVSNEARPLPVADRWIDCLLQEFFGEARLLKAMGEEPLRTTDPDLVRKPKSQCDFLTGVAMPMTRLLARVFPSVEENFLVPICQHLRFYSERAGELEAD